MKSGSKLGITLVLFLALLILLLSSCGDGDQVVVFPDPNLEAAICEAIGKPIGDIYQSELEKLTLLRIPYGKDISDLTGLEHCSSLTDLQLDGQQIRDISPISSLTKLVNLDLGWNLIDDITPLSNLARPYWISLRENDISDITPLSNLTSLNWLDLGSNKIDDVSALSGLTNLTRLYLHYNQIDDITPLFGLPQLGTLWLDYNEIDDISVLVENTGIGKGDVVNLRNNPLNAMSVDVHIPQLNARGVMVCWSSIVAFPDPNLEAAVRETIGKPSGDIYISDLEDLMRFDAGGRGITDLSGLEYCAN